MRTALVSLGKPDVDVVVNAEIVGRERDPKEITQSGVGVGSTEAEVQAGVGGATCASEYGFSHCRKGSNLRAGNRITDFVLDQRGGEVTSVYVGFVID